MRSSSFGRRIFLLTILRSLSGGISLVNGIYPPLPSCRQDLPVYHIHHADIRWSSKTRSGCFSTKPIATLQIKYIIWSSGIRSAMILIFTYNFHPLMLRKQNMVKECPNWLLIDCTLCPFFPKINPTPLPAKIDAQLSPKAI